MANPQRLRRVADQIQRELSGLLRAELKDPRVGMITLTGVEVSPDLGYANVFFTTLADAESLKEIETGLAHAAGFLRVQLGKRLSLRVTPAIRCRMADRLAPTPWPTRNACAASPTRSSASCRTCCAPSSGIPASA